MMQLTRVSVSYYNMEIKLLIMQKTFLIFFLGGGGGVGGWLSLIIKLPICIFFLYLRGCTGKVLAKVVYIYVEQAQMVFCN